MLKHLFIASLIVTTSVSAQVIDIDSNLRLTYFHSTNSSVYVGASDNPLGASGNIGDLVDLGYQGYVNYQLESDFSLNLGAQPSIMRRSDNSFHLFVPLFLGANYGKEGFSDLTISEKKIGFFVNFGIGPVVGILNSSGNSVGSFAEIGTRLNFRGNDISLSLLKLSYDGYAFTGGRLAYHFGPF